MPPLRTPTSKLDTHLSFWANQPCGQLLTLQDRTVTGQQSNREEPELLREAHWGKSARGSPCRSEALLCLEPRAVLPGPDLWLLRETSCLLKNAFERGDAIYSCHHMCIYIYPNQNSWGRMLLFPLNGTSRLERSQTPGPSQRLVKLCKCWLQGAVVLTRGREEVCLLDESLR